MEWFSTIVDRDYRWTFSLDITIIDYFKTSLNLMEGFEKEISTTGWNWKRWNINFRRRRIGYFLGYVSVYRKMARPWLSRDERLFTGQRFPFNGYTWLALCTRTYAVFTSRPGRLSEEKGEGGWKVGINYDETNERSFAKTEVIRNIGVICSLVRCGEKKRKKPILRRGNAEGEDGGERGGGGGIVIRWRL